MRPIDADWLYALYEGFEGLDTPINAVMQNIDDAPTIDAVEVVHGHWIVLQNEAVESICYWSEEQKNADKKGAGTMAKCKCSNCNWRTSFMGHVKTGIENMFNYCPNCGAKMDEVK